MTGEADGLLDRIETEGREVLGTRSVAERLRTLGRAGVRFLDPADPLRLEAEERVPQESGLHADGVRTLIDGMARDWTAERLEAALVADFEEPAVLDGFRPGRPSGLVRAVPPRLLVQIGSGNVAGTGATALVRGLLVGAPTLLKPGTGDQALAELLARAIVEEEPDFEAAFAVEHWRGGDKGRFEERALARAERVVVYGSWRTVRSIRERVPPWVPVVAYGHRIGFGIVARECMRRPEATRIATSVARAVAAFEQRGCVSPHAVWIEEGGEVGPGEWAGLLAEELETFAEQTPPPKDPDTAEVMRQLHDASEMNQAAGNAHRVYGGPGEGWMVLFEPEPGFEPSCLGRTIRVHPMPHPEAFGPVLAPLRRFLQSAALDAPAERREALGDVLARCGVTRITDFANLPWPPAWWRHDGDGPLRALVRWVAIEEGG